MLKAVILDIKRSQISILRTLARAYFLSGSYDRAEATLDELVPNIDNGAGTGKSSGGGNDAVWCGLLDDCNADRLPKDNSGYQELRWLRLAILKRRKAGESALLEGRDWS